MGYLAAAGAYLIIGLVVSFILMVVGLFIGHIIVFDSIALGIISGVCCNHFFTLHPALCVLIGAAVFTLLLFLQKTRFGFWVIGVLLSAAWAVIFGLLAFIISNADQLWFYVVCGLAFIVMCFCGFQRAKNGMDGTLYSNLKKCLSNVPRKSKKEWGAVPTVGNRAPALF